MITFNLEKMIGLILCICSVILYLTRNYFLSLTLFFSFLTNWFQLIPNSWMMAGVPLDKSSDIAIIYVLSVLFFMIGKVRKIINNQSIFKWSIYLIFFAFIVGIYSVFILKYPITSVIQVFRYYIFFLSFPLFYFVPVETLKKVFHLIVIITILQSILFLIQVALNQNVLQPVFRSGEVHTTVLDSGYVRYYNSPPFLVLVFFYLFFVCKLRPRFLKVLILVILIAAIIAPMHRSLIFSVVIVLILGIFVKRRSLKSIIYTAGTVFLLFLILSFTGFAERGASLFMDLATTFKTELDVYTIDISENTFIFRLGHFLERFLFVLESWERWFFGIGMISDNSVAAQALDFKFGLISEDTGKVVQIDTADLIWSPLILNLGFAGCILYVTAFVKFTMFSFTNIRESNYAFLLFLLLLSGFMISVTSSEMLSTHFRTIVLLLLVIINNEKVTTKTEYNY